MHWLDTFLLYMVTDQDISFLVRDLCSAMVRNDKFISADVTEDTIENYVCFCYFQIIWTLCYCRINTIDIHCLKNKLIWTHCKTGRKNLARGLFLKLVPINCMLTDNVRILSIYSLIILESCCCHSFDHQCLIWKK